MAIKPFLQLCYKPTLCVSRRRSDPMISIESSLKDTNLVLSKRPSNGTTTLASYSLLSENICS